MYDREAFNSVATDIDLWQSAALQLPLPELSAIAATWQNSLAEGLNTFNDIYADAPGDADAFAHAIGEVTRRATATAILALGIAQRLHLAAQQN